MFLQMRTTVLGHKCILNINFSKENKKTFKKQISSYLSDSDLLSYCAFGLTYLLTAFAIFTDLVNILFDYPWLKLIVWLSLIEFHMEKWNSLSLNFFLDTYFSFFEQHCKINVFEFYLPWLSSLSLLKKHVAMMNTDVSSQ